MREHTEALAPPRALWVPFMLGRPFGVPNDAAFQRKVLIAALQLFERESGPVLEDFPQDAPHQKLSSPPENLVCPVSFPRMQAEGTLAEKLADEVSQLQAWHAVAVKHRGRTTLGVTGMPPLQIVDYLSAWLDNQPPQPFRKDISPGDALKQACDELKAFYLEAKSVQPGQHSAASILEWFWMETALAQAIVQIRAIAANSTEPSAKAVAVMSLIPRSMEAALKRVT
ncbi:MAG: hypothetical protein ABL891_06590 [Burkholderiales bacterium]